MFTVRRCAPKCMALRVNSVHDPAATTANAPKRIMNCLIIYSHLTASIKYNLKMSMGYFLLFNKFTLKRLCTTVMLFTEQFASCARESSGRWRQTGRAVAAFWWVLCSNEWIAAHGTPQQVALRCRIVLSAADGESDSAIARRLFLPKEMRTSRSSLSSGTLTI